MPTLEAQLQEQIARVRKIADENDINKKVILKAEMAMKSRNQLRMERYLATLRRVADPSGTVAKEEASGDDDAASDE